MDMSQDLLQRMTTRTTFFNLSQSCIFRRAVSTHAPVRSVVTWHTDAIFCPRQTNCICLMYKTIHSSIKLLSFFSQWRLSPGLGLSG